MGYAVQRLSMIDGLILMNTAAFRSPSMPLRIGLCRVPFLGRILVRGLNGFAYPATFMAVTRKMDNEVKKAYLRPYNSWNNRIAVHRFVLDIPMRNDHPSYDRLVQIEKGLQRVRDASIPMLLLWGGKDFCFTKTFYQEWVSRFPNAMTYYFENYGHYLLEDGFEEIGPHLDKFLSTFVE